MWPINGTGWHITHKLVKYLLIITKQGPLPKYGPVWSYVQKHPFLFHGPHKSIKQYNDYEFFLYNAKLQLLLIWPPECRGPSLICTRFTRQIATYYIRMKDISIKAASVEPLCLIYYAWYEIYEFYYGRCASL